MRKRNLVIFISLLVGFTNSYPFQKNEDRTDDSKFISYIVNPKSQTVRFFLKNETGENFKNSENLKRWLGKRKEELVFAMNGGMYNIKDLSPQGLYIENENVLAKLDTVENGYGNFYLQPNGVFYLTNENLPFICKTSDFNDYQNIKYATQSGPLLLIDGQIHPKFTEGSKNVHIRNGVGVLPDGNLLFAMSKEKINFYDFATYFKNNDCKNALYLDGFVSRTYLPSKHWEQLDGNFGVIIAETKLEK